MIYVYNELNTPWIIRRTQNPNLLAFSKLKKFKNNKEEEKKGFTRVNFNPDIILDDKTINERLDTMVHMKDVELLSDEKLTIVFDPKTYEPTLYQNHKKEVADKKILLLSLYAKNLILTDIFTNNTFMIEHFSKNEFFGLIVSFNGDKSDLNLTFYDENKNKSFSYIFTIVDGELHLEKINQITPEEITLRRLRKFKPARLTQAILSVAPNTNINTLSEYSKEPKKFKTFVVNFDNYMDSINDIIQEGFKAITVYVPSTISEEETNVYRNFINDIKMKFRVLYTINENNILIKVKVN